MAAARRAAPTFSGTETFTLGGVLGGGESGRIYKGTFGTRAVVVKVNGGVTPREDVHEAMMQVRLYCHLEGRRTRDMAGVPEAVFAATVPGVGRALGMARVDRPLLADVKERASVGALHQALRKVARLLALLQDDLQFMHGDLHAENVMMRGADDVFLIDFGMASAKFGRSPRMLTNERYAGVRFNPHLDLLTLLTALREDLALAGRPTRWPRGAATSCSPSGTRCAAASSAARCPSRWRTARSRRSARRATRSRRAARSTTRTTCWPRASAAWRSRRASHGTFYDGSGEGARRSRRIAFLRTREVLLSQYDRRGGGASGASGGGSGGGRDARGATAGGGIGGARVGGRIDASPASASEVRAVDRSHIAKGMGGWRETRNT